MIEQLKARAMRSCQRIPRVMDRRREGLETRGNGQHPRHRHYGTVDLGCLRCHPPSGARRAGRPRPARRRRGFPPSLPPNPESKSSCCAWLEGGTYIFRELKRNLLPFHRVRLVIATVPSLSSPAAANRRQPPPIAATISYRRREAVCRRDLAQRRPVNVLTSIHQ